MKNVVLILNVLLCSFAYGQFKVDVGEDIIICCCLNSGEREEVILIQNPVIQEGVEPYTYSWSGKHYGHQYPNTFPKWIFASDILDDTTKSNPTFKKGYIPDVDYFMTFYLRVEDATGNVQYDSLNILKSSFWIHPIYKLPDTIIRGDSIKLIGNPYIKSNYMPLVEFMLSPSHGLDDSTDINGYAKPDTSITYYLQAIDSLGCSSAKIRYMHIEVIDTLTSKQAVNASRIECYFSQGKLIIKNIEHFPYFLTVSDLQGKLIHRGKYSNQNLNIPIYGLKLNQIYIITIKSNFKNMTFKLLNSA